MAVLVEYSMILIRFACFTVAALVGFGIPANAETPCPELERLRSEATEASKQVQRDPETVRCGSYHRLARAREGIVEYVHSNRESCGISDQALERMEKSHREAVRDRNNFCAGRLLFQFPSEVKPR
jgi:hypothetical protein